MAAVVVKEKDRVWSDSNNSLMRLNEAFPEKETSYAFSDVKKGDGPQHAPSYSCVLKVQEQEFVGSGRSKQAAKRDAADLALHTLFHQEKLPEAYMNRMKKVVGDPVLPVPDRRRERVPSAPATPSIAPSSEKREHSSSNSNSAEQTAAKRRRPSLPTQSNPVYVLNQKHKGMNWELIEQTGPAHEPVFRTRLTIDGNDFTGEGASKRLSRSDAARRALSALDGIELPDEPPPVADPALNQGPAFAGQVPTTGMLHKEPPHSHSSVLANRLQRCCLQKFVELRDNLPDAQHQFKVLAGVVQLRGGAVATEASASVVALATGTKCIHGENLSLDGTAVNDCHAEVLARRAFCMYAHDQIRRTASGEESVFERISLNGRDLFALNPVVSFHLFISSAPCGDARLFTMSSSSAGSEGNSSSSDAQPQQPQNTPVRAAHGKLRQKMEAGEGGVLNEGAAAVQTLDGLAAGERLRTMSCSDKVVRWNCLGIQGSLLSRILFSPIYFETLTVGDVFHYDHMYRAVYGRLAGIALPKPFWLQRPFIAKSEPIPSEFIASRTPSHAINWYLSGGQPVEVIDSSTGKRLDGLPSRLCKKNLAAAFTMTTGMLGVDTATPQLPAQTYHQLKLRSSRYQEAKLAFFNKLSSDSLGTWVHKPIEQEQFPL